MGDLIQFVPRSNHKANRAFWIGERCEQPPLELLALEIMNQCMGDPREALAEQIYAVGENLMDRDERLWPDTAPCEYSAPEKDPA